MTSKRATGGAAQAGRFANTGDGPQLIPVDIGHATHLALIDPDTAFWSLVRKSALAKTLGSRRFLDSVTANSAAFAKEMTCAST